MIWITLEQIIELHTLIMKRSGGLDGVRDRASLESAVAAPLQSFGGQDLFPGEIEKIARLGYGLASNHAFVDGNKRIGALATQLLLQWNGYHLSLRENELSDMFIAIADGQATEQDLLNWVKSKI